MKAKPAILIVLFLACIGFYFLRPQVAKPNVLLIMVDDLNDWVGFLKDKNLKMPNLDRLASKSYVFTNAHAPSPLCNPSRASILSGMNPIHTGVINNQNEPVAQIKERGYKFVTTHFRDAGYKVMGAGKVFHRKKNDLTLWDEYQTIERYVPHKHKAFEWQVSERAESEIADAKVAQWIADKLKQKQNSPFLMIAGFFFPHHPWVLPQEYFDMNPLEDIELPEIQADDYDDISDFAKKIAKRNNVFYQKVKNTGKHKQAIQAYLAGASFLDKQLGRVLDSLEASSYAKNTILVFMSDHGTHLGEKSLLRKSSFWEPALHVPLLIYDPRAEHGHVEIDDPVSLVDIFPTLNKLCDLSEISNLDGQDILDGQFKSYAFSSIESQALRIRTKNWNYILYKDGSRELYNLKDDPNEYENLAADSSYAALIERFETYINRELQAPQSSI